MIKEAPVLLVTIYFVSNIESIKLRTTKSKRDVDRLMKAYSNSILDTYLIIPDDDITDCENSNDCDERKSYFVNWPMDLTDDDELPILKKYDLRSLGWSYRESTAEGNYNP